MSAKIGQGVLHVIVVHRDRAGDVVARERAEAKAFVALDRADLDRKKISGCFDSSVSRTLPHASA